MSSGAVMLDLEGPTLSARERELLAHPNVGGVILFTRNYTCPEQLTALVAEIHTQGRVLVAVDQEGGRVQRFRDGFTQLPPIRCLGEVYDCAGTTALQLARKTGWLMAAELRSSGVDFSFAPVLDLDRGVSEIIGDRAFHRHPDAVSALAHAYIEGMSEAGMGAVIKHFPGHGGVGADSHHELPVDERTLQDLQGADLVPYERLIRYGVAGIMPAHIRFPRVDSQPAGFSRTWLQLILRENMGFQGMIFSDDLSMEGAAVGGDLVDRARLALAAGCDMVLVCNNPAAAERVTESLSIEDNPLTLVRRARMHGRKHITPAQLRADPRWQEAVGAVERHAKGESFELEF